MSHKKNDKKPISFHLSKEEKETLERLRQFEEADSNIQKNEHILSSLKIIFHGITLLGISILVVFGTIDLNFSWMSNWRNWVNLLFAELFVYLLSEIVNMKLSDRKKKGKFLINFLLSKFFLILASIFVANCAVHTFDNQTWVTVLLGLVMILAFVFLYFVGFKEGKRRAQIEAEVMNKDASILNNLTKRFSDFSKGHK